MKHFVLEILMIYGILAQKNITSIHVQFSVLNCFKYFQIYISGKMFLFYGLHFLLHIYYSTIYLYIRYDLLLQQHFYSPLLLFYVPFCLRRINTFLALVQQIIYNAFGFIFLITKLFELSEYF